MTEALWDAWAFAAVEAELALAEWFKAAHHLKDRTYTAYRDALDREEEAAARLATNLGAQAGLRLRPRRGRSTRYCRDRP